jgi:hypothetical protein
MTHHGSVQICHERLLLDRTISRPVERVDNLPGLQYVQFIEIRAHVVLHVFDQAAYISEVGSVLIDNRG